MSTPSVKPAKPVVLFFPGKGMLLKHYRSYFPCLTLVETVDPAHPPAYILCHSRGINEALKYKGDVLILALDPTYFSTDPRVVSWTKLARQSEVPPEAHVEYYSIDTHYPYMFKTIRDRIVHYASCSA